MFEKQEHLKNLARYKLYYRPNLIRGIPGSYSFTSNSVINKGEAEIGSCRNSFDPSFGNWKVTKT